MNLINRVLVIVWSSRKKFRIFFYTWLTILCSRRIDDLEIVSCMCNNESSFPVTITVVLKRSLDRNVKIYTFYKFDFKQAICLWNASHLDLNLTRKINNLIFKKFSLIRWKETKNRCARCYHSPWNFFNSRNLRNASPIPFIDLSNRV